MECRVGNLNNWDFVVEYQMTADDIVEGNDRRMNNFDDVVKQVHYQSKADKIVGDRCHRILTADWTMVEDVDTDFYFRIGLTVRIEKDRIRRLQVFGFENRRRNYFYQNPPTDFDFVVEVYRHHLVVVTNNYPMVYY